MERTDLEHCVLADLIYQHPHPAQDFLNRDDFSSSDRKRIFDEAIYLRGMGLAAPGLVAMSASMAARGGIEAGLATELVAAGCAASVSENIRAKVHILKRMSANTLLKRMGERMEGETEAMLADAIATTAAVSDIINRDDSESEDETIDTLLAELEVGPDQRLISTGMAGLDWYGRLERGSVTVLGARTSVGKTSLACTVALSVAIAGHGVCYIAAEEAPRVIIMRLGKAYAALGKASLSDALKTMKKLPLSVRHTRRVPGIALRCADAQSDHGAELLVVDHLQELHAERPAERIHEIGELLRGIRQVASERNVAVLLLCQLSRKPDQRQDKRPELSDLRDSGEIEQKADRVWLLHRKDRSDLSAELFVAKNRTGPTGSLALSFEPEAFRFVAAGQAEAWA